MKLYYEFYYSEDGYTMIAKFSMFEHAEMAVLLAKENGIECSDIQSVYGNPTA